MLPAGQSERPLEGFLEAAPDAMVIITGDGVIARVNRQTEKLFGYRREELIGRPVETLMPERFRHPHIAHRQAYAAKPELRAMGSGLDLFGLRKDGFEFPIDVSISPMPFEARVLLVSAIRDMTAHRRLEEKLRARTRELEEADRQKDQLLSAVAHELRSPLGVLTNVAQLLNSPQSGAALYQWASGALERQTAHMSRMVEDLLDLARIRRGKLTLHLESIDLRAIAERGVEMSRPLIDAGKHSLEVALPPDPLPVSGDPGRLVQVVSNLLNNAAKFTPERGHIRLTLAREDGLAAVRVRDDGKGISKEMLSRVFDIFTQVDPAGVDRAGGLGIGLALVRQLVELHGGTVEAFSDGPGQGSEFVVRLPLLPKRPEPQNQTLPLAWPKAAY